jgi:hypothetical protein
MFRRLAREAVIFMLLGMALAAVGSFVYMHHAEAKSIQAQRDSLKMLCDGLTRWPIGTTAIEQDGVPLVSAVECGLAFGKEDDGHIDYDVLNKQFGGHAPPLPMVPIPPGTTTVPVVLAADYDARVQDLKTEGTRIKNLKIDNTADVFAAAVIGLYGFAGGLGVWLFYRLVRFAVKG